jgi:hypothetical protein
MTWRQRLQTAAKRFWGRRFDVCVLLGAGAIAAGVALIYPPAGVITAGVAAASWGIVGARTEAAERRRVNR